MWTVLYDDGMSLTTASERIARGLAEAERQRGRRVTVLRLGDVETHPRGVEKPARPPGRALGEGPVRPQPIGEPEPALASEPAPAPEPTQVLRPAPTAEPMQAAETAPAPESPPAPEPVRDREPAHLPQQAELTREPGPARAPTPARRRRLLLYALAAASIVVAAALVDHWGVLPRIGADTSSSPTQVSGPPHHPQLLPPLDQPPVVHFRSAVHESSGGGPSTIAWGGAQ